MFVTQTHLTQATATGVAHLKTWLPVNPKVRPGVVIELDKNPEDLWKVEEQFATMEMSDIQRGWGLNLPKTQRTER